MKRIILSILLAVGMCSGILLIADWQPSPVSAQTSGKEVPGKSVATGDGTLVCDCTAGGTTCKCLVPKNDEGFEIQSGPAN